MNRFILSVLLFIDISIGLYSFDAGIEFGSYRYGALFLGYETFRFYGFYTEFLKKPYLMTSVNRILFSNFGRYSGMGFLFYERFGFLFGKRTFSVGIFDQYGINLFLGGIFNGDRITPLISFKSYKDFYFDLIFYDNNYIQFKLGYFFYKHVGISFGFSFKESDRKAFLVVSFRAGNFWNSPPRRFSVRFKKSHFYRRKVKKRKRVYKKRVVRIINISKVRGLNKATLSEIISSGISPVKSLRIIDIIRSDGGFSSWDEVKILANLSDEEVERLKRYFGGL